MKENLIKYAHTIGISLTDSQAGLFEQYMRILQQQNEHTNLTAIRDEDGILSKHFLDSLSVAQAIPKGAKTLIDVGSGAGFPGIPIKIARPEITMKLVESVGKKADFTKLVIHTLGLENIQTLNTRAEDLAQDPVYRETFDVATGRAVANLSTLLEYTLPFLKIGGLFIAQKKTSSHTDNTSTNTDSSEDNEIESAKNALDVLGGTIKSIIPITLPTETGETLGRQLIIIEKIRETPKEYPRRIGKPLKKPL